MGALYREIVKYKYYRSFKIIQLCILAVISLDIIFLLSSLKTIKNGLAYVGYGIFPIAILAIAVLWNKSRVRFRYAIIDNEIIIERLYKDKRKVELNLNVKQIVKIERMDSKTEYDKVERHYNFACSGSKKTAYRCIFKKDEKLYSFCFEPSSSLINKIEMVRPL